MHADLHFMYVHSIQVDPAKVMIAGDQCGDELSALKVCGDDEASPELNCDQVCASRANGPIKSCAC